MGNVTRTGVLIGLFFLLGVNLSSVNGVFLRNIIDFKNSENLKILPLINQGSSENLPDNSTWTDYPVDDDANGYYDQLVINLGSPKTTELGIYGLLNDSKGNLLGISQISPWDIRNELLLSFPGKPINANGENGPFHVWVGIYSDWYAKDVEMLFSYTTVNYNASDFESPNAKITGFSDYGNDTNNDGVLDDIIFELTIDVKDPGSYQLSLYLEPSAPFPDSNQDLVEYWESFLTPENTTILVRFPIYFDRFHYIHGPLNVSYLTFKLYNTDIQLLTDAHRTNSYFFEPPLAYVKLTGNYWDWGVDDDSDEGFDLLVVTVEVNITLAGIFSIDMHLTTPDDDWSQWSNYGDGSFWNKGVRNITLTFDASMLYSLRNDTPLIVEYVGIRDESHKMMDYANSPYTTRIYSYTEFDLPRAYSTGKFMDHGIDTTSDGKIDQLVIDTEVNFTDSGRYRIEFFLRPFGIEYGDWSQWVELDQYWQRGVRNVSQFFDASQYYSLRNNTSFELEYIQIYDDFNNRIDYSSSPYITRIYNHTEFDIPKARLTGNYWGRGDDTTTDKLFDFLALDIEINVTEAADYVIRVQIESATRTYNFGEDRYEFLNGGLHWISFLIDGPEIFRHRENTSFFLSECRIYSIGYDGNWGIVDQIYKNYSTRLFKYTEFVPPRIYLTGNFWEKGVDTDSDGKFNELAIDVEVNIRQEGFYGVELQLRPYIPVWDSIFWGSCPVRGYDPGVQNISVLLYVTLPYSLRLKTAYVIQYVSVLHGDDHLDSSNRPFITRQYEYSEFDFPFAVLTGNYWDYGVDTDGDGGYDSISIDVEINVTQPRDFLIEFYVRSRNYEYSNRETMTLSFGEGIHNISLSIATTLLYSRFVSTYFILKELRITNENFDILDRMPTSFVTKLYRADTFDVPRIFLTNNYFAYPVSTDNDEYKEELRLHIQVNVTEAGTYTINLAIRIHKWTESWDLYDSDEFTRTISQYLEEGVQYVIIPIDGTLLYEVDYDTTRVEIYSLEIFDFEDNLCVSLEYPFSSNEYDTNLFYDEPQMQPSRNSPNGDFSLLPSNIVFGFIVLLTISIILYLLQRPSQY